MSACLLGHEVRYDGGHKRAPFLIDTLGRHVEWVPVCPEVELGLGVPREPIRLQGDPKAPRLVAPGSGRDLTEAMRRLAGARAAELARAGLSGYVFKADSPSCGVEGVAVHGRGGRAVRRGTGLFARALRERLPLLPVEEEGRLRDPAVRENFLDRVLAYARWQRLFATRVTRRRLVAFHAAHTPALLAHDPAACRRLRALVADATKRPLRALVAEYGAGFMRALATRATSRRRAKVPPANHV